MQSLYRDAAFVTHALQTERRPDAVATLLEMAGEEPARRDEDEELPALPSEAVVAWLTNPWVRAALVHPLIGIAPVLAWLIMHHTGEGRETEWLVGVGLASPVASFVLTVVMALGPRGRGFPGALIILGFAAMVLSLVLAVNALLLAIDAACAGRYECPF